MQGLIPMSHETAFSTPFSLHQFVAPPFGLFRAPVMFQWLMYRILPCAAYATYDDMLHDDMFLEQVSVVGDWSGVSVAAALSIQSI